MSWADAAFALSLVVHSKASRQCEVAAACGSDIECTPFRFRLVDRPPHACVIVDWLSCAVHSRSCEQLTAQQKVTRMRIEIEFAGCAYEQDCGTMRALETFGKTGQFAARPASNLTVDALIQ